MSPPFHRQIQNPEVVVSLNETCESQGYSLAIAGDYTLGEISYKLPIGFFLVQLKES